MEILGHIFEQSITDLERIEQELAAGQFEPTRAERRKREGAFYTPRLITRYIVGRALGRVLAERFEALRRRHQESAAKGRRVLDRSPGLRPRGPQEGAEGGPDPSSGMPGRRAGDGPDARPGLRQRRVPDRGVRPAPRRLPAGERPARPSCGGRTLFDLDRTILQHNLYGVDLNDEAIEICRLSLWIKTAERGKELTSLDHTIRVGNSVVADPDRRSPAAFDWQAAFPEVFADGGFDVVVGNPPYVRQECWAPSSRTCNAVTALSRHGRPLRLLLRAGLKLLKPGGRLSFVVTNKWMKAGYGEPLRRLFRRSVGRIGRRLRPRQADLRGRRRLPVDRGPGQAGAGCCAARSPSGSDLPRRRTARRPRSTGGRSGIRPPQ